LLPAGAVAGWGLHPLENAALSRRTPVADVDDMTRPFTQSLAKMERAAQFAHEDTAQAKARQVRSAIRRLNPNRAPMAAASSLVRPLDLSRRSSDACRELQISLGRRGIQWKSIETPTHRARAGNLTRGVLAFLGPAESTKWRRRSFRSNSSCKGMFRKQ
jgi:hypothetical protein